MTPAASDSIRVTLVGNFLTGLTLDGERLRYDGYEAAQERVTAALNRDRHRGWAHARQARGSDGLRFAIGDRPNEVPLPLSFVGRSGIAPGAPGASYVPTAHELTWRLENISLGFFDFGVGSLVADYALTLRDAISLRALRGAVEDGAAQLVRPYNSLIGFALSELSAVLKAELDGSVVERPWFDLAQQRIALPGTAGELLWLHRVYIVEDTADRYDDYVQMAPLLLPTFFERREASDFCYLPGLSASAVILRGRTAGGSRSTWVIDTIAFQFAYVALFMELDRALLAQLTHLTVTTRRSRKRWSRRLRRALSRRRRGRQSQATEGREQTAGGAREHSSSGSATETISGFYERIRWVRALVNTSLATSGASAATIWEATARVQVFDLIERSVDDKLSAVQALIAHRAQEAAASRARLVSRYVATFTIFAVASSIFAVIDFMLGGSLLPVDSRRLVIATSVITVCLLIVLLARRHGAVGPASAP